MYPHLECPSSNKHANSRCDARRVIPIRKKMGARSQRRCLPGPIPNPEVKPFCVCPNTVVRESTETAVTVPLFFPLGYPRFFFSFHLRFLNYVWIHRNEGERYADRYIGHIGFRPDWNSPLLHWQGVVSSPRTTRSNNRTTRDNLATGDGANINWRLKPNRCFTRW